VTTTDSCDVGCVTLLWFTSFSFLGCFRLSYPCVGGEVPGVHEKLNVAVAVAVP